MSLAPFGQPGHSVDENSMQSYVLDEQSRCRNMAPGAGIVDIAQASDEGEDWSRNLALTETTERVFVAASFSAYMR